MRTVKTVILVVILLTGCEKPVSTDSETSKSSAMEAEPNQYNAELAASLGADEYGMKSYVMAFLKRGTNRDRPQEEAMELQRAHLDNIRRLAEEGKLLLAGPFLDKGDLRGIYIFDVRTIEEAEELTKSDPAIQKGQLVMELVPWYGSAALMKLNEIHKTLASKPI